MAKVDITDIQSFYMNPSAYSNVKEEKKTKASKSGSLRGGKRAEFSDMFDEMRTKTAGELGPLHDLPVSEDSLNFLMDEVRSAGDILRNRPLPDEIMNYKQAVRNFISYVVKNSYELDHEEGIKNKFKSNFKGRRSSPEAEDRKRHSIIKIVDNKLENLAAMLVSSQMDQLKLLSRLDEIRGLLVDLLQ